MSGLHLRVESSRKTVILTLPSNPPIALRLKASDVDALLSGLGKARAKMQPSIDRDYDTGQVFLAVKDPRWVTDTEVMAGHSVVHIRDPRFGWLHYSMPKEEARKLGGTLVKQADSPIPLQAQGKLN